MLIHTTAAALLTTPFLWLSGVQKRIVIHHNPVGTYQGGIWVVLEKLMGSVGFYTHIVFVGQRGLDEIAGFPAPYRRRATLILNGVSLPPVGRIDRETRRTECDVAEGELFVLSVGGVERQKNQQVLVDAVARCQSVRLVVAGDGSLRPGLMARAEEAGASVTWLGKVPRTQVAELYRCADVLAFPSLHEGRSLTLLEAVLAELPVVSSDIPENRAVLGNQAVYLDPTDVEGWAATLQELSDDATSLQDLRSRLASQDVVGIDQMTESYLTLFG